MKYILYLLCFSISTLQAGEISTFSAAWNYISEPNKSERYLIIGVERERNIFFECENLDDTVRCVVPLWVKRIPETGPYLPVGGRNTPYPDIQGSVHQQLINSNYESKAINVFKEYQLDPFRVYSQIMNKKHEISGTQGDLRVMIPFSFKSFEELAKAYLKEVYGVTESDRYVFDANG